MALQFEQFRIAILGDFPYRTALEGMLRGLGVFQLHIMADTQQLRLAVQTQHFEILFVAHSIHTLNNPYDVIADLIAAKQVPLSTRIVYLYETQVTFDYSCEYPFHQSACFKLPLKTAQLTDLLQQHQAFLQCFEVTLSYLELKQFRQAIHALKQIRGKNLAAHLLKARNHMIVNALTELGHYRLAERFLAPLLAKKHHWAQWAQFSIHYRLKDFAACLAFLQCEERQSQYPVRCFYWQIYLAMQQQDHHTANTLIKAYPVAHLSPMMLRLSTLVLTATRDATGVATLLSAYSKCHPDEPSLQRLRQLLEIKSVLFTLLFANPDSTYPHSLASLTTLLQTLPCYGEGDHQQQFQLLMMGLMLLKGQQQQVMAKLTLIVPHDWQDPLDLTLLRAYWAKLDQHDKALSLFAKSHHLLSTQLRNCRHVLTGVYHRLLFECVYPPEERITRYRQLILQALQCHHFQAALTLFKHAQTAGFVLPDIETTLLEHQQMKHLYSDYLTQ
ncbi:hypothetical protein ACFOEE_15895 [Pseudoalteromonas fenneropenaei]|uniref:Uncharacterized protein n=1 Tax=Pseudoalteromonas fenneropenaei TaxID=1737459 RepID=A0ABV7CN54_9GAMM